MQRFMPDQLSKPAPAIHIYAARNEWEPFQVVVASGARAITVRAIDVSDLTSARGRIAAENVRCFREHYIEVKKPSYRSDAQPGWYPDALIPVRIPKEEALAGKPRFVALPAEVPAGRAQAFWVEAYVPKGTAPGDYRGAVTFSLEGGAKLRADVTLTVFNFELPDRPSMRSHFPGIRSSSLQKLGVPQERWLEIQRLYENALCAHRLMPSFPAGLAPPVAEDGTPRFAEVEKELIARLDELHWNSIQVPFRLSSPVRDALGAGRAKAARYLRAWRDWLKRHGRLEDAYIYCIDEPNDPDAYERVRQAAKLIHEAAPGLKLLVTEQPTPQKPEWGNLFGAVDIWCPLWPLWNEEDCLARQKLGEEFWTYTALCQGKQPTPWWELDFPLLNYRVPLWMSWHYNCVGLLYWSTTFWSHVDDPWTEALSFRERWNQEGMLFYPGPPAGTRGPVASMRLKMLREGMEDFEYLKLGEKVLGRERTAELCHRVARSWWEWEKRPEVLEGARVALGEEISRAVAQGR